MPQSGANKVLRAAARSKSRERREVANETRAMCVKTLPVKRTCTLLEDLRICITRNRSRSRSFALSARRTTTGPAVPTPVETHRGGRSCLKPHLEARDGKQVGWNTQLIMHVTAGDFLGFWGNSDCNNHTRHAKQQNYFVLVCLDLDAFSSRTPSLFGRPPRHGADTGAQQSPKDKRTISSHKEAALAFICHDKGAWSHVTEAHRAAAAAQNASVTVLA